MSLLLLLDFCCLWHSRPCHLVEVPRKKVSIWGLCIALIAKLPLEISYYQCETYPVGSHLAIWIHSIMTSILVYFNTPHIVSLQNQFGNFNWCRILQYSYYQELDGIYRLLPFCSHSTGHPSVRLGPVSSIGYYIHNPSWSWTLILLPLCCTMTALFIWRGASSGTNLHTGKIINCPYRCLLYCAVALLAVLSLRK